MGKKMPANVGDRRDVGLIPGLAGGGHGNPLQYSAWRIPCPEEPGKLHSIGLERVGQD